MKGYPDKAELNAILDWAFLERNNEKAWKRFLTAMSCYSLAAQVAAAKLVEVVTKEA